MSEDAELRCRCGKVRGRVRNTSPRVVNRAVCYCDDCQAYLQHLGRTDLMDEHGGTDVVQVAPASLEFHQGTEHIRGLRLGPKGLYRWYADCCKTPIGNTLGVGIPFVGIVASDLESPDDVFGKPRGGFMGKYAIGTPPEGSTKLNLWAIVRVLGLVAGWRLSGKTWPHPFFDRTRTPRYPLSTLSREERDALRPLCGPHPTST